MNGFLKKIFEFSAYLNQRKSSVFLENLLIGCACFLSKKQASLPVCVYGASFNPTTLGHSDFIRCLIHSTTPYFAKISLIPARQSVLKTAKEYASISERIHILDLVLKAQLNFEEQSRIRIELLELNQRRPSWMVLTLSALILQHWGRESYILACGYDHVYCLTEWYRWRDLAGLCQIHFYPRVGIEVLNKAAVSACIDLCKAKLHITVFFKEETEKEQFYALWLQENVETAIGLYLNLICDPEIAIRDTAASDIRAFYHNQPHSELPPPGLSLEAHRYIVEHQCYGSCGQAAGIR